MTVASDPTRPVSWLLCRNGTGALLVHAFSEATTGSLCGKTDRSAVYTRVRRSKNEGRRCALCSRVQEAFGLSIEHPWRHVPTAAKFWAKTVRMPSGCLEWTGRSRGKQSGGKRYGGFSFTNFGPGPPQIHVQATHFAFATRMDRWPNPCALHKCDNPPCVDPEHLFEGTQKNNIADMDQKRRRGKVDPAARVRGARHYLFKITDEMIADIRARRSKRERVMDIAAHYALHVSTVSTILHGRYRRSGDLS